MSVTGRRSARAARLLAAAAVAVAPLAGAGAALAANGDGTISTVATGLFQPRGMARDGGGTLYEVEFAGHRIRRVNANGTTTNIAGTGAAGYAGDGEPASPTETQFNGPTDVVTIGSGPYAGTLIADEYNNRVRRIAPDGTVSTVAGTGAPYPSAANPLIPTPPLGDGGPALNASLNGPRALAATDDGGFLIADEMNNRVRQVAADGTITTVAGNGVYAYGGDGGAATSASLRRPLGVAWLGGGHFLIADGYSNCIRDVNGGIIRTVAGRCGTNGFAGDGGPASLALLARPRDVIAAPDGGLYIADSDNDRVRRVAPDGTISTVAGTGVPGGGGGGPALEATLNEPSNLLLEASGDLLVSDTQNGLIRRIDHPLPTLVAVTPGDAPADGRAVNVSVTGTGFPAGAVVLWNGSPRTTTRVSSTKLVATITGADLARQGTASISVRTGAGGGDATASSAFTIGPPTPPSAAGGGGGSTSTTTTAITIPSGPSAGQTLTVRVTAPKRVRVGRRFFIVIVRTGPAAGARVVLQRRVGRHYRSVGSHTLRAATKVRFRVRPPKRPTTLRFRAVVRLGHLLVPTRPVSVHIVR